MSILKVRNLFLCLTRSYFNQSFRNTILTIMLEDNVTSVVETKEEKERRHAQKENNLRLSLRGNSIVRNELLKKINRSFAVDNTLKSFEKEIERLFSYPENYVTCEIKFNILFDRIKISNNKHLQNLMDRFKTEIQKLNYLKTTEEILRNKKNY